MPLWKIAFRSIQFRSLSSILTAFSMSLGVALIVTVIVIHGVLSDSFNKSAQGYDLIISGKGSSLDVVLSTVFYLRPPVGNVPEHYLKMFRRGQYSHIIEEAIPVTIGHHFRGATIVGVPPEFFTKLKYMGDRSYTFADGENIKDGNDVFTAVVGSRASQRAGLKIGDTFKPELAQDADCGEEHKPFKVVGVLNPTGTPNDNAVFVHIEGFYDMHESHDLHGHHEVHGEQHGEHEKHAEQHEHAEHHEHEQHDHKNTDKKYSAILLMTKQNAVRPEGMTVDPNSPDFNPSNVLNERTYVNIDAMNLPNLLDQTTDVQAVKPIEEIAKLLSSVIGNIQMVLIFLAVLIVIVAGIGMMVSIYNSMSERRQEIAIMRALGARRLTVMAIILLESILLSLGGGVLGLLFGHLLIGGMGPWISEYTGIIVRSWNFQWMEIILIPGLIILASVVGFLPAAVAYKQDVATSLAP
ncbi:MAG: ABC transporter permease [Planctomycetaceae bacterium]|jgi:putative ABC transport system permease protein|nr:ABC transporter permease [Planctomycetaceae bacterium]